MQVTTHCKKHSFHRLPIRQWNPATVIAQVMGKSVGSSLPEHGVGFLYDNSTVFPRRSSGREFQHCSYPYPGSCCGYRFPSGTKSEGSKAANVKALSQQPTKFKLDFSLHWSGPPRGRNWEELVLCQPKILESQRSCCRASRAWEEQLTLRVCVFICAWTRLQ